MYIYKSINLINGKFYIGQCTREPQNSKDYFGSGVIISKALLKYGKENFSKIIIETDILTIDALNEREIYWIAFYDSTNPSIGYNISGGGAGSLGIIKSEETREKLRIANIGKKQNKDTIQKRTQKTKGLKRSVESRLKISKSLKLLYSDITKHPMFGKKNPHSEETIKKISDGNKGKKLTEEHKQKISNANKNKKKLPFSKEHKQHMSDSHKGHKISDETKKKMSKSRIGKYSGPSHVKCPFCGKNGSSNAMYRWHFDNCKNKLNAD